MKTYYVSMEPEADQNVDIFLGVRSPLVDIKEGLHPVAHQRFDILVTVEIVLLQD